MIGPPLIRTGMSRIRTAKLRPPRGPPLKIMVFATSSRKYSLFRFLDSSYNSSKSQFLLYVPANIHFFTFLQKHHISQFNEKPCKTQKQNCSKTTRISIKIDQPGPQNSPPEITFSASYFHQNLKMPYWNHSKNNGFHNIFTSLFRKKQASKNDKKVA